MISVLPLFLFFVFVLDPVQVFAQQQKNTISGTVKDKETGETLIGATIRVQGTPSTGTLKNEFGFNQEYFVNGGIGLISTKLNVEGAIQKEKSSFLLSGRRTKGDIFLELGDVEVISGGFFTYPHIRWKMYK